MDEAPPSLPPSFFCVRIPEKKSEKQVPVCGEGGGAAGEGEGLEGLWEVPLLELIPSADAPAVPGVVPREKSLPESDVEPTVLQGTKKIGAR